MLNKSSRNSLSYDLPAAYQIRVRGRVGSNWSDRLEGMTILLADAETNCPVTTLEGELIDQAALAGVLNTLYELHLTVLEVKRLTD
jgi:hypothetical protein